MRKHRGLGLEAELGPYHLQTLRHEEFFVRKLRADRLSLKEVRICGGF